MNDITLTHIGGPTTLLQIGRTTLMTDPTLDPGGGLYPLFPQMHLAKTDDPRLPAESFEPLDAVLLSHDQHADNLDAHGRAVVARAPLTLTTPSGAQRLGGTAVGLSPWETHDVGAGDDRLRVTAVPGRHGPPGSEAMSGDVTGFIVQRPGDNDALWMTGDTVWYDDLREVASRYNVRWIIGHFGDVRSPDGASLTMSSADLRELTAAFSHAIIVPVHWEGWAHFREGAEGLRQADVPAGRLHFVERGVRHRLA